MTSTAKRRSNGNSFVDNVAEYWKKNSQDIILPLMGTLGF